MARRRQGRKYGAYVQIPGLSQLDILKEDVSGMDVVIGAALASIAGPIVDMVISKVGIKEKLPAMLAPYMPALTSVATGAALYYGQGRSARARGHMVGALASAAGQAAPEVKKMLGFSDVVSLPLGYGYGYGGMLVDEATPAIGPGAYSGYGSLIVDEPMRSMSDMNLSQLAALSMADGDQYDMDSLMSSY